MKKYPLGAEPSEYDPRDYSVCFVKDDKYIQPINWPAEDFIPDAADNYDQNGGTCVAQSTRYGWQRFYGILFGTNWLYGGGRPANARVHRGMSMRNAADFACKNGLVPYADDPGELEVPQAYDYVLKNLEELKAKAAPYTGWTYARLYTVDEIKAAIRDRRHIIFRMGVGTYKPDKAGWWSGKSSMIGYHAVVLKGYGPRLDKYGKSKEAVIVRNSWGEDWGINGDCYMTWDDVLKHNDIYVFFPPSKVEPIPDPIIKVRRTLKKGMSGDDVLEAQKLLLKHGFFPANVEPKGNFGPTTYKATLTFQKAKGLVADGIIGKNTWTALDADPFIDPVYPDRILEFVEYLKARVGDIYVWGGQGENDITESWIKKRETTSTNAKRAIALWQKRVKAGKVDLRAFDCSGLIMYFVQNLKGWYKSDMSANSIYNKCEKIKRSDLKAGDLVFRKNSVKAYHVGVYVGDGKVVEAKGRDDGVVMRDIDASGYWNKYGRLAVLQEG